MRHLISEAVERGLQKLETIQKSIRHYIPNNAENGITENEAVWAFN